MNRSPHLTRCLFALLLGIAPIGSARSTAATPTEAVETPATPSPDAAPPTIEAAQAVLIPFKKSLKAALMAALPEGPAAAIGVCQSEAPTLTAAASSGKIRVGRTSAKLRNPANVAPAWLAPILAGYAEATGSPAPHQTVALPDGGLGYAEPITVQPPCLMCHGENVDPSLTAHIAERYPTDQATGYQLGDLRGLFWVEMH
jgi:hypothetical protein